MRNTGNATMAHVYVGLVLLAKHVNDWTAKMTVISMDFVSTPKLVSTIQTTAQLLTSANAKRAGEDQPVP